MRRALLLAAIACFCVVAIAATGTAMAVGPVADNQTTDQADPSEVQLQVEPVDEDDSDTGTVSYTFDTGPEAEHASITPVSESLDFGDVTFEFDRVELQTGGVVSSTPEFDVENNTGYRVFYDVEASASASEGEYTITSAAEIEQTDGPPETNTATLAATVDHLEPELDAGPDLSRDVVFTPEDDGRIERVETRTIFNDGPGMMDVEDVSALGVPFDIDVAVTDQPDTIAGHSQGDVAISIEVEDDIFEGEYDFTVEIDHSLGQDSFDVTLDISKPSALGVKDDGQDIDFGETLVGEGNETTITLVERGGYTDVSDIEAQFVRPDPDGGDLSFTNLDSLEIDAGGTAELEVEFDLENNAERGEELEWNYQFTPEAADGIASERVQFRTSVIYPPYFASVDVGNSEIVFDEPRDETDHFVDDVTLEIENGGDLPMENLDVSVSVEDPDGGFFGTVSVTDVPTAIQAGNSRATTIEIEAEPDSAADDWAVDIQIEADEPTTAPGEQTGEETTSFELAIEHETELAVPDPVHSMGEVTLGEDVVWSTPLVERLGYQAVENLSIERDGPDDWLTVTSEPAELPAGEERDLTLGIEFDTDAEAFEDYTWEFTVSGDSIETETVSLTATARPADFEDTVQDLQTLASDAPDDLSVVGEEMATALDVLNETLQVEDGSAQQDDIPVMVSAGRSVTLFVEAAETAADDIDDGAHEEAQGPLVRAAAAFNSLSQALGDVETEDSTLQSSLAKAEDRASQFLTGLIADQETHFESQFDDVDTTVLEEAQLARELARLAELGGDSQRAADHRTTADEAFDTYTTLVEQGNADLVEARAIEDDLDEDLFFEIGGQRLFWVGSLSTFEDETDEVLARYNSAIDQFEEAGMFEQAERIEAEREQVESAYDDAYLLSLALGVVAGFLLLVFLLWEMRALYRYRVDTGEAVTGDFLLPWEGTE